MNLDLFLVLMIPMTLYGFMTKAFRNSHNTMILILVVDILGWYAKLGPNLKCLPDMFLATLYVVLLILYIRAIFFIKR